MTLSKSQIMRGLQCEKYLYYDVHHRDLAKKPTESEQAIFDQGDEVGVEAQKLYPGGILIDTPYWDVKRGYDETVKQIRNGAQILFEATLAYDDVATRADILLQKEGVWEIIEVKSATSVKAQYLNDAAIQFWVFKNYGLKIEKISIMHINNQCVHPDLSQLFTIVDVTEEVERRLPEIPGFVSQFKKILQSKALPQRDIGPHCYSPYPCTFIDQCWQHVKTPSVFDIPKISKIGWELYREGLVEIDRVPVERLNEKQARQLQVLKTGERFVDPAYIKQHLREWKWPLSFLDFESFNPAIPLYEGTRPFQQIPFQFSCHLLETRDSELKHFEYLHQELSDPRESLAHALVSGMRDSGSIIAYNKAFESGVLRDLADLFPQMKDQLLNIASRLVDPLPIIRESVYDPQFLGSFSLKSVAPALIGERMSYKDLDIAEGGAASLAYLNLIKGQLGEEERTQTINAMLRYCRQDTLATVELVKWLYNQTS